MGLAEYLLGAKNPFASWVNDHQNYLSALGAGLGQGQNIQSGLSAGLAAVPQAKLLDDKALEQRKAETKIAAQTDAFKSWLSTKRPDLVPLLDTGVSPAELFNQAMAPPNTGPAPTTDIQNFEYGQSHPGFLDFQTQKGGAAETSLTPTWGTDSDPQSPTYGQTVLGQLNKAGKFVRTELPAGVLPMDPRSLAGERTTGTADAKTAAAARAALPAAQVQRQTTLDAIDRVTSNEAGLNEWFGQWGPRGVYVNPGSKMGNFVSDFSQAEGQSFLQARQFLKGQGAITEIESAKAELAYSRMAAAKQSGDKQNFLQAAADFKQAVEEGYAKLEATAQGGYAAGSPAISGGGGNQTSTGVQWSVTP